MTAHHNAKPLSQTLHDEDADSARIIRRVVKIGCLVNALLMVLKLSAGYFGHSDALMADGFHSLNDLAADIIMLIFIGISYRAADARYSYGYGKFETFSSFLMSSFLILIALMIGCEGVESIVDYAKGETLQQPDIWTFIVVLFAMACKESLFHFYYRAGKRAESKALMANAWHHRSDALASVATLIGVTCAHFFGPAFRVLDPVASLLIAIFILIPALRLFRPSFAELMERSLPQKDVESACKEVEETPGVEGVRYIRSRRNGHNLIFDIGIEVDPSISVDQGAAIAARIEQRLHDLFCPHVFVSVNTFPCRSAVGKCQQDC